eukprot:s1084_g29.t1
MLGNALLRDPDRGLAHFKDTVRPYFVKGVSHAFLWRFLHLFRTDRGQNEFAHWIGRFEIAQKRLLASWSDPLDLSDLPEAGTEEVIAALTAAQQLEMQNLPNDEAQRAFQTTLRETTIEIEEELIGHVSIVRRLDESKGKGHAAWDSDQQDTAFWQKRKGKKGKKGVMKGKDSFKGMPWKGGKGKGKDNKGGKQALPSQNVAQTPASSSTQPEKQEHAQFEEGWGYDTDTYWTDDWSTWYYDYDVDYSQDNAWYSSAYFASFTDQPETETSALHVDGQTDQQDQICFHMCCLFRLFGHGLMSCHS